jgi:hypothetical protein
MIPDAGSNIKIKLFSHFFRPVTAAPVEIRIKMELIF